MRAELPHIAADILMRLRARGAPRALHHQCGRADLHGEHAARGGRGSLDDARAGEIGAFVARADGLLVNLGTFDAERRAAAAAALRGRGRTAHSLGARPGVHRSLGGARGLCEVAGRAEAERGAAQRRGVCGALGGEPEDAALAAYARDTRAVMALTGTVDRIADGAQQTLIENGHPLMARVTAMGCAASALTAAFLAVESDAFKATASALLCFGVAGGLAGERASGPGSFPAALLDALYALDKHTLTEKARVT